MDNKIKSVDAGSVAEEMGIEAGDRLVAINGRPVVDIMDFLYFMDDDEMSLVIQKANGEEWELDIEKSFDEILGLNFVNPIMDQAQRCTNQCLFCFIDQLPKGMRKTLYFKDDDSRLSFLMGNFVTLTNMNEATFQRLIDYRISPINVSVHAVDPDLRIKMLGNKHAGLILDRLIRLKDAGIEMNGQVVLCPGLNDGLALDETIEALSKLYPYMFSMAVVPIGLTQYRQGLYEAVPVDNQIASAVLHKIEKWQEILMARIGTRFVFAADEFFLKANRPIPAADYYEGYVQIENGVGLLRQFEDDFIAALALKSAAPLDFKMTMLAERKQILIATSTSAYPTLKRMCALLGEKLHQAATGLNVKMDVVIEVVPIINHFFGEMINVTGLLTGKDIIDSLMGRTAHALILSNVLVNSDGVLLDDITPLEIEQALGIKVMLVDNRGAALVDAIVKQVNGTANEEEVI